MATSVGSVHKSSDLVKDYSDPDQMLTLKKKSEYNVKIASDKGQTCYISGTCSLPSGETIVVDYNNKRVKMFDKHYNVSSDLEVGGYPQDICQISPSQVAVTFQNKVQLIGVSRGKLVEGDLLQSAVEGEQLQIDGNHDSYPHATLGIAYNQGDLYLTSGTALYQYTLHQKPVFSPDYLGLPKYEQQRVLCVTLVKKLYEDTRGGITVHRCAVSPDGNWIYVTNFAQNKLLTLATDGIVLSTFTDPELQGPKGVHVTPAGQVFVCGLGSHTVIQVDHKGRKKLATLASEKVGISFPITATYNAISHQMIVGEYAKNKISVLDLH